MSDLAVTALSLSHFRSHKSARIEVGAEPLAIYGPNGAGKTNLIEAVSLFSPGRGIRRAKGSELIRRPEALGWKLSCVLQSQHQVHELETWAEADATRHVKIDDKPATQTALGRLARMVWLVPSMDRLWIEGADGRRRFLDRMTLSFEPNHAEITLRYEKAMRERNRLLKDQVRDAHWYVALESQMAEAGVTIQKNRQTALTRLAEVQTLADTIFPAAALSLTAAEDTETPDNVESYVTALADNRQRDLYAGRTLIGPHRADLDAIYTAKNAPAHLCSTGEQKALLISLILSNARALSADLGAPPILLLDEVAAHLDADRRAALYDEICALRAQAWMTGTGRELFEALGPRARYFEVTEADGVSEIHERT